MRAKFYLGLKFAVLCAALFLGARGVLGADDNASLADPNAMQAIPKVPTMATIVGDGDPALQRRLWAQNLIKKKEIKARVEVVILKKKLLEEADAASVEEKDRQRRTERYNNSFRKEGELALPSGAGEGKKRVLTLRLEFQVPEIDSYKKLIEVFKIRATLAENIVTTLTKLDRDADGKLSGDEYRDAALLYLATQRLFHSIDNDDDGYFSASEIEAAKTLPADGIAAITAGSATKEANSGVYKIKDFDINGDGVLSVSERKAMSSAYLDVGLKARQEAENYQKLVDDLLTLRQATAAKFANVTVESSAK